MSRTHFRPIFDQATQYGTTANMAANTGLPNQALFDSGTTIVAVLAHNNRSVICTAATLVTIELPTGLPVGWRSMFYSTGAAGLTVDSSAVTLLPAAPKDTITQGEGIYIECVDTDDFILVGGTST